MTDRAGGVRRALFLDRDGVINHDAGYTHRWEDFVFVDGIFDLCREAHRRNYLLFVVTNQAGIGRGYYTEADFHELTKFMCARFVEEGAPITRVYFDPTHPTHGIGDYRRESPMRKPNPGMLLLAAEEYGVSLADSVLIGDNGSDIRAGVSAGIGTTLWFQPPVDRSSVVSTRPQLDPPPTAAILSLQQAIDWLR